MFVKMYRVKIVAILCSTKEEYVTGPVKHGSCSKLVTSIYEFTIGKLIVTAGSDQFVFWKQCLYTGCVATCTLSPSETQLAHSIVDSPPSLLILTHMSPFKSWPLWCPLVSLVNRVLDERKTRMQEALLTLLKKFLFWN